MLARINPFFRISRAEGSAVYSPSSSAKVRGQRRLCRRQARHGGDKVQHAIHSIPPVLLPKLQCASHHPGGSHQPLHLWREVPDAESDRRRRALHLAVLGRVSWLCTQPRHVRRSVSLRFQLPGQTRRKTVTIRDHGYLDDSRLTETNTIHFAWSAAT